MKKDYTLTIDDRGVAYLTISRPHKCNAFDLNLIVDLTKELIALNDNAEVRVVVLSGEGDIFSSGADLIWMKSMVNYNESENIRDALTLSELMSRLYKLEKPTIAKVNGGAYGGAIGLVACCDVAIASNDASFSFSEVRLGIIPAVISPYIVESIGVKRTKSYFLTGEKISAENAVRLGLLHDCVASKDLDEVVEENIKRLLAGGPTAQFEIKKLLNEFSVINEEIKSRSARTIARLRVSPEGQEGITAFLEKRKSAWVDLSDDG